MAIAWDKRPRRLHATRRPENVAGLQQDLSASGAISAQRDLREVLQTSRDDIRSRSRSDCRRLLFELNDSPS